MKPNFFDDQVKQFTTFMQMSGLKMRKEHIIRLIRGCSLRRALIALSILSNKTLDENLKLFKEPYIQYLHYLKESSELKTFWENVIHNFYDELNQGEFLSPQGLLNLWKWLLAYGDQFTLNDKRPLTNTDFLHLILLCHITSDYLSDITEPKFELTRNYLFNFRDDPLGAVTRTFHIYSTLAKDKGLYNPNEYLDFNKDFEDYYGYTLEEYASTIIALYSLARKSIPFNPNTMFSTTQIEGKAMKITLDLTMSFQEARRWSFGNLNNHWDYTQFTLKPLLQLDNSTILPIHQKSLFEHMFPRVFWKINDCYKSPDDRQKFMTFFGRPFEKYVQEILSSSCKESRIPYRLILNKRYGSGRSKEIPEALICLGKKLIAIEAKSKTVRLPTLVGSDPKVIHEEMKRMVIEPIKQVNERVKELIEGNEFGLGDIKEVYLIAVTRGEFPMVPPLIQEIEKELEPVLYNKVVGIEHFHIKDLEHFSSLLEEDKLNVFKVLKRRTKHKNVTFDFYLNHFKYKKRPPILFRNLFHKYIDLLKMQFFGTTKDY